MLKAKHAYPHLHSHLTLRNVFTFPRTELTVDVLFVDKVILGQSDQSNSF